MIKRVSFVILSAVALMAYESLIGGDTAKPTLHVATDVEEAAQHTVDAEQDVAIDTSMNTQRAAMADHKCVISRFDPLMRKVGAEEGFDWRLMSAIAYSESRFIEDLVSNQGAAGIMQIRPVVARHFNVPVESIHDTETNIRLAGMLLSELDTMLRIPASTPERDRLSIILASYNAGIGHVLDARRLARAEGANPNSWDVVSDYLVKKADPAYYELDVVQCGKFNGSGQTLGYVKEVMGKYAQYCNLA